VDVEAEQRSGRSPVRPLRAASREGDAAFAMRFRACALRVVRETRCDVALHIQSDAAMVGNAGQEAGMRGKRDAVKV
jgi:hypothetical protein